MSDEISLAQKFGFSAADAKLISNMAFDLVDAGDLRGAEVIFIGLLALNPMDAAIRAALGAVLQDQGRIDEAEAEYDRSIASGADTPLARLNRGELRLRRGDPSAHEDLQAAAKGDSPLADRARRLLSMASPQIE